MVSDIVARLRDCNCGVHCKTGCIQEKAAAEIERLRAHKRAQAEDIMTLGQQVGRLEAEIERLRAERNLAVEMLQSAERELAAERAARIAVASPVREEGEE